MKKKASLSLLIITLALTSCGKTDTSTDILKKKGDATLKHIVSEEASIINPASVREEYTTGSDGYTYGTSLSDEVSLSELNQSALKIVNKAKDVPDYIKQSSDIPEDIIDDLPQEYKDNMETYNHELSIIKHYGDISSIEQLEEVINNKAETLDTLIGEQPTEDLFTLENGEQLKQDICDKKGHILRVVYLNGALECERINEYYIECETCGQILFNGYVQGPLHEREETVLQEGSCSEYRIVATTCKLCGKELNRTMEYTDDHTWETTTENIWDPHTEVFVEKEITWCRYCNTVKEEEERDEN